MPAPKASIEVNLANDKGQPGRVSGNIMSKGLESPREYSVSRRRNWVTVLNAADATTNFNRNLEIFSDSDEIVLVQNKERQKLKWNELRTKWRPSKWKQNI